MVSINKHHDAHIKSVAFWHNLLFLGPSRFSILTHELPANRQPQQRRLQWCEYLFQDYPKFAQKCQRFAVFNILYILLKS